MRWAGSKSVLFRACSDSRLRKGARSLRCVAHSQCDRAAHAHSRHALILRNPVFSGPRLFFTGSVLGAGTIHRTEQLAHVLHPRVVASRVRFSPRAAPAYRRPHFLRTLRRDSFCFGPSPLLFLWPLSFPFFLFIDFIDFKEKKGQSVQVSLSHNFPRKDALRQMGEAPCLSGVFFNFAELFAQPVELQGLQQRSELNGRRATVREWVQAQQRYAVALDYPAGPAWHDGVWCDACGACPIVGTRAITSSGRTSTCARRITAHFQQPRRRHSWRLTHRWPPPQRARPQPSFS